MARPLGTNVAKIVFQLSLYGVQPASFALWYDNKANPVTQAVTDTFATPTSAVGAAGIALTTSLAAHLDTGSHYSGIKYFGYDPAGNLTAESQYTNVVAGTGSAKMAPQVAVVATLLTAKFGRSYHGRVYLPCTGDPVQSTGMMSSATTLQLATAVATYITNVSAGAGPIIGVASFSKVAVTPVTSVRVDGVFDTQRRRRDQFVSTTTSVHTSPPAD